MKLLSKAIVCFTFMFSLISCNSMIKQKTPAFSSATKALPKSSPSVQIPQIRTSTISITTTANFERTPTTTFTQTISPQPAITVLHLPTIASPVPQSKIIKAFVFEKNKSLGFESLRPYDWVSQDYTSNGTIGLNWQPPVEDNVSLTFLLTSKHTKQVCKLLWDFQCPSTTDELAKIYTTRVWSPDLRPVQDLSLENARIFRLVQNYPEPAIIFTALILQDGKSYEIILFGGGKYNSVDFLVKAGIYQDFITIIKSIRPLDGNRVIP